MRYAASVRWECSALPWSGGVQECFLKSRGCNSAGPFYWFESFSLIAAMTPLDHSRHILDSMLGYLGFTVQIEEEDSPEGPTLQILTEDTEPLIGRRGEILDDMQYLVNRILRRHLPDAPRIRVDVEYYRSMREDKLVHRVKELANRVRATGVPAMLYPMNSYYRRIVHNVLVNDQEIASVSEEGSGRFKRITLKRK